MARRKNVKRIDPRYFLEETTHRDDFGRLDEFIGPFSKDSKIKKKEERYRKSAARGRLHNRLIKHHHPFFNTRERGRGQPVEPIKGEKVSVDVSGLDEETLENLIGYLARAELGYLDKQTPTGASRQMRSAYKDAFGDKAHSDRVDRERREGEATTDKESRAQEHEAEYGEDAIKKGVQAIRALYDPRNGGSKGIQAFVKKFAGKSDAAEVVGQMEFDSYGGPLPDLIAQLNRDAQMKGNAYAEFNRTRSLDHLQRQFEIAQSLRGLARNFDYAIKNEIPKMRKKMEKAGTEDPRLEKALEEAEKKMQAYSREISKYFDDAYETYDKVNKQLHMSDRQSEYSQSKSHSPGAAGGSSFLSRDDAMQGYRGLSENKQDKLKQIVAEELQKVLKSK